MSDAGISLYKTMARIDKIDNEGNWLSVGTIRVVNGSGDNTAIQVNLAATAVLAPDTNFLVVDAGTGSNVNPMLIEINGHRMPPPSGSAGLMHLAGDGTKPSWSARSTPGAPA